MSFRSLLLFTTLLLTLSAPAMTFVGHCQRVHHPKKLVREQIEDLEEQWRQATLADDVPAIDKLLSDDYLGITINGELMTKTQQLDRMRSRALVVTKLDLLDLKVKVVGQVAIVTSLAQVKATSDGRPIDGSFRYTRVYQYVGASKTKKSGVGTWKITSFEMTRVPKGVRMSADAAGS